MDCFTDWSLGGSRTFRRLWKQVAQNLDSYRTFPRLAGGQNTFIITFIIITVDLLHL